MPGAYRDQEARRGLWIPWNWSYRQLWGAQVFCKSSKYLQCWAIHLSSSLVLIFILLPPNFFFFLFLFLPPILKFNFLSLCLFGHENGTACVQKSENKEWGQFFLCTCTRVSGHRTWATSRKSCHQPRVYLFYPLRNTGTFYEPWNKTGM